MVPPKNNQAPKKGIKKEISWRIRTPVSAGPNVGSVRNSNVPKGAKGTSSSSRVSEDLILFKEDSTRPVSGNDKPSGPYIRQKNRPNKAIVVIHPIESTDSMEESTTPILCDKLSTSFDLSSQVPKPIIHMDEYAVSFRVYNFVLASADPTVQTADDCIFKHLDFGANNPANWSIAGIQSESANVLDTPGLTFEQAVELYKFGRGVLNKKADDNVNEKARAGFFALNFTIKGRISPPRLRDDCVPNNDSEVRALKFQRTFKKGNFVFTLVRKFGNFSDELDVYWKHRVAVCSQQGLWPIFHGHVTETLGRRFKDWYTNPTKFLPREPWMAEAHAERSENGIQRYVTQNVRNKFGSMAEWEIVLSAAVIHDVATSIKLNEQYYNWDRTYEVIVRHAKNDYVQLEFDIPSRGELSFPSINGGTQFLVKYGRCVTAEDSNAELENYKDKIKHGEASEVVDNEASSGTTNITNSQEIIENNVADKKKGEQAIYGSSEDKVAVQDVVIDGSSNIEWTAQVLVAEKNKQFVISFIMPHVKKRKFHVGSKVDVQLKVLNSHLATTRQLKAIGMIAENKARDDTYGRVLQRFILGEGMADVKDDIEDHLLSLKEIAYNKLPLLSQKIYDQWLESCNLNPLQREAYDAVIEDVLPATIIQGQYRTGKSLTNAVTCVGIAQLGYKVLYATPTNAAAETALLSIFNATQKGFEAVDNTTTGVNPAPELLAEIKESKENFGMIHFPANASTENDFMKRDDEGNASEKDNPLDTYRISNHVIESFQRKANNPESSNTIRTKAHNWLATLQRVREGKPVAAECFVKEGLDEMEEVVRDTHTKIIISTCNNSAALRDMRFKPQVVVLDDASASREPDCIIPLTLEQARVGLYGDAQKKGLWLGVKSWGSNEFAAQLSRSLFERLVALGNIGVVQLEQIDSTDPVIDLDKR
ncbi:hypothetical protein BHYA_0157g00040 [Botrytis hyacinthi]|uniref:DNA2/NAM7 helicase helicase domain-containing protein n=1 Tax=Botrytis hyacinthi TaxID=278943 RepID=A0A4Z1GIX8_9HELO|nr:hypothetical protein BHYA_0157g00040 [Botrytis hyacinthi]